MNYSRKWPKRQTLVPLIYAAKFSHGPSTITLVAFTFSRSNRSQCSVPESSKNEKTNMGPFLCVRLLEFNRSSHYKASELELIQDNVRCFFFVLESFIIYEKCR